MTKYTFEEEKAFFLDYHEVEDIINEEFRSPEHKEAYELPPMEEVGSGTGESLDYTFSKCKLSKWDIEDINEIKKGHWKQFNLRTMMQHLVNEDILPEGRYIIYVGW